MVHSNYGTSTGAASAAAAATSPLRAFPKEFAMFQNRITPDNGQADAATLVADANGKTPHATGKRRKSARAATPSTNESIGGNGRSGDLPHTQDHPSPNGLNGAAGRSGDLPHV